MEKEQKERKCSGEGEKGREVYEQLGLEGCFKRAVYDVGLAIRMHIFWDSGWEALGNPIACFIMCELEPPGCA